MPLDKQKAKNLKAGEFLIGKYHSSQLKSLIERRPVIVKPNRKTGVRDVPFRSGSLLFDEKSYENFPLDLELYFKSSNEDESEMLRDLITFAFDSGGYMEFVPYFDKRKIYYIKAIQAPSFQGGRSFNHNERYSVSFTGKPFKRLLSSEELVLTNGQTVTNPSLYPSKPIFTIKGQGDITLTVNGKSFVMKNIQDSVIVNTAIPSAYRYASGVIVNEENKTYTRNYPIFESGQNRVGWSGNVQEVKVETRWQTL